MRAKPPHRRVFMQQRRRGLRPPGQLSRPYLVADDPRRAGRTAHLACAPSGSCAWPRIPGSFAAPRGMHAVPAHQGGHPLSRLPLIDDGVVRCANQGCTLCLADTDPVAEGLAAVKSTLNRCQNRGDGVRFRASH